MHEGTADDPPSTVSVIRQKGADTINESSRGNEVVMMLSQEQAKLSIRYAVLQYNKDEDIQKKFESCV